MKHSQVIYKSTYWETFKAFWISNWVDPLYTGKSHIYLYNDLVRVVRSMGTFLVETLISVAILILRVLFCVTSPLSTFVVMYIGNKAYNEQMDKNLHEEHL